MTPLEEFNELKMFIEDVLYDTCKSHAFHYTSSSMYLEPFINKTEKNVKALEIIKTNAPNITLLLSCKSYERYIELSGDNMLKEEYDLVREVLL